jgi:glyoxylase-like metal-dependent hydrolase (beta-lactamase superfamily II)
MQSALCSRGIAVAVAIIAIAVAQAQQTSARDVLEQAAAAMGGLDRLQRLDNLVMTGFGQYVNQQGGSALSPDPHAPLKWTVAHDAERVFDLKNERALSRDRRGNLFPFAAEQSLDRVTRVQTGVAALDHPVPALLEALDAETRLGPVSTEGGLTVVQFTIDQGATLWVAVDPATKLPAWVRSIGPSTTLGDITTTTYFTGYLPFGDLQLPVGLTSAMDWRDVTSMMFNVDSYRVNATDLPAFPAAAPPPAPAAERRAEAKKIADKVWDVRIGGNGGAVIEFADHLVMFEAYNNEADTFARLDVADALVPGKKVTHVIVTHHHFDHSGGLRAAVSRGLTIVARRGNEGIFREMVARPAPNFPDALARNPQPLKFVPVDEHLALDDGTMRVDVYHAVGHLHMAEAVFAYIPTPRIFLEGDFTTYDWDFNWWGGAYLDNVERYGLSPAINIPVHGIVDVRRSDRDIEAGEERARLLRAASAPASIPPAGAVRATEPADGKAVSSPHDEPRGAPSAARHPRHRAADHPSAHGGSAGRRAGGSRIRMRRARLAPVRDAHARNDAQGAGGDPRRHRQALQRQLLLPHAAYAERGA